MKKPVVADRRLTLLSAVILGAYAVRVTIPVVWIYPVVPFLVNYSWFFILAVAFVYMFSKCRVNLVALIVLLALMTISLFSTDIETALIRTSLWALVFTVVGPFFIHPRAMTFRNFLWKYSGVLIVTVTICSFFWNISGLPLYGKGAAGVTVHCMLLGAIAGLSTVYSFNNLLHLALRSPLKWAIFIASVLTCMVAGSRAAVLSAAVGCMVVLIMRIRSTVLRSSILVSVMLLSVLLWVVSDFGNSDSDQYFESNSVMRSYTKDLVGKGTVNTREQLWEMRLVEFNEYPITGVGIGIDTFRKSEGTFGGSVIEPGSSYLAALSMTGLIGTLALALLLFNLCYRVMKRSHLIPIFELNQAVSIGAFWAIHAVAEGWIFAAGSFLCLLFWIWVGRLVNLAATLPQDRSA